MAGKGVHRCNYSGVRVENLFTTLVTWTHTEGLDAQYHLLLPFPVP